MSKLSCLPRLARLLCLGSVLLAPVAASAYPFAYLPQPSANRVDVVDVADNQIKAMLNHTQPVATEVLPGGRNVVVATAGSGNNKLYIYSSKSPGYATTLLQVVDLLDRTPVALASSPDNMYIWVSVQGLTNRVIRVSLADFTQTPYDLGFIPGPLVSSNLVTTITSDGTNVTTTRSHTLYVAESNGMRLGRITTTNDASAITAPHLSLSQTSPASLALNSDGTVLFASYPAGNRIGVFYTGTGGALAAPLNALGVQAIAFNGSSLYAGTPNAVKVWTIGLTRDNNGIPTAAAGTALTDIAISGTAQQLSTSADGKTVYLQNDSGAWVSATSPAAATSVSLYPIFGRFMGPYASVLQFTSSTPTYEISEGVGSTTTIFVSRTGDLTTTPSFRVATSDRALDLRDSAIAGQDYVAIPATGPKGLFTFAENEESKLIPIEIINDGYYGNAELFNIGLIEVSAPAVLGANSAVTVTINDDDKDPRDDRNGCSLTPGSNSKTDPLLPLLAVVSAGVLYRRSRKGA